MWYIILMKRFLKDIAQGIYDGLQENEATHNQYSFQEIYDVIQEFVSYVFVGLILSKELFLDILIIRRLYHWVRYSFLYGHLSCIIF